MWGGGGGVGDEELKFKMAAADRGGPRGGGGKGDLQRGEVDNHGDSPPPPHTHPHLVSSPCSSAIAACSC